MWFLSSRKTRRTANTGARRSSHRPLLEALEDRCLLSGPGSLDPTFGTGGIVTPTFGKSGMAAYAGLLQPNGDIVAVGQFTTNKGQGEFGLARYTPSGSLDSTFGSGGDVTTAFGKTSATAWSAALYPNAGTVNDGKIVAAGSNGSNVLLARYNTNGSLDTTFGSGGTVTTAVPGTPFSAAIQSDGKIVLGGDVNYNGLLLRYNVNGALDTSFGQGGEVVFNPTSRNDISSVAILPNGDIVAGGDVVVNGRSASALAEYTPGGTLDTTFGSGGLVTTPSAYGSVISGIALRGDGKIVAVGGASPTPSGYKWGLARYNADGSLDTTFGSGGTVVTQIGTGAYSASAVALQSNGEIVAAGTSGVSGANWAVATYTAVGALDLTFGGTGIVTTNLASRPASVLIQPADGKVVVIGSANIARYIGTTTGPRIGSFTATPNPVTAGNSVTLTASNITDPDPGSTVTQVAFYVQANGSNTLLGYGTQISPGVWTFAYTVNLAPGSYTLIAQAQDSDGVLGDPVSLTLTVQ